MVFGHRVIECLSRSFGMQSNAFERSIETMPTTPFEANVLRIILITLMSACSALYFFLEAQSRLDNAVLMKGAICFSSKRSNTLDIAEGTVLAYGARLPLRKMEPFQNWYE